MVINLLKKLKNYHDIIEFLIYNIISRQQYIRNFDL